MKQQIHFSFTNLFNVLFFGGWGQRRCILFLNIIVAFILDQTEMCQLFGTLLRLHAFWKFRNLENSFEQNTNWNNFDVNCIFTAYAMCLEQTYWNVYHLRIFGQNMVINYGNYRKSNIFLGNQIHKWYILALPNKYQNSLLLQLDGKLDLYLYP